jgi:hypothetical protein
MAIAYVDEADALNPIATALSAAVDEFPIAVPKEPVTEDDEPTAVAFVKVEVEADAPNRSDAVPLPGLLMPPPTFSAPLTPTPPVTRSAPVFVPLDAAPVPDPLMTRPPAREVASVVVPIRRLPLPVMRATGVGAVFTVPIRKSIKLPFADREDRIEIPDVE